MLRTRSERNSTVGTVKPCVTGSLSCYPDRVLETAFELIPNYSVCSIRSPSLENWPEFFKAVPPAAKVDWHFERTSDNNPWTAAVDNHPGFTMLVPGPIATALQSRIQRRTVSHFQKTPPSGKRFRLPKPSGFERLPVSPPTVARRTHQSAKATRTVIRSPLKSRGSGENGARELRVATAAPHCPWFDCQTLRRWSTS